jgi:hypothetical protein
MLQFNTYKIAGEPWAFPRYVKKLRKLYSESDYSSLAKHLRVSRNKYKSTLRYHLINSRIYLWGLIESDFGEEAKNYAIANYSNLDNYSRQEFLGCLKGLGIDNNIHFSQFRKMIEESKSKIVIPQKTSDRSIALFEPRRSGFFSVIENIIVALYIAEQDNVSLMLSPEDRWWPYDVPFHLIFENFLGLKYNKDFSPQSTIAFDSARTKIAYLNLNDATTFYAHKRNKYSLIHSIVSKYSSDKEDFSQGAPIYFVRAGDKLDLETVLPPVRIVDDYLREVAVKFGALGIISDDYEYAEQLKQRLINSDVYNLTSKNCNGHKLSTSTSSVDVDTILKNFLLLICSPVALSCPSSNLVNAAHWARKSDEKNIFSALNPVEKYLLF